MPRLLSAFLDKPPGSAPLWARIVTVTALLGVFSLVSWGLLASTVGAWQNLWPYRPAFLSGWWLTVQLSAVALVSSTVLGVLAALGRRSSFLPARYLATGYVELVRGMPFLVLILLLFYGIPEVTRYGDRFFFGVAALSLFAGAYIAEIVRAGIQSIGETQWESARAIGLTTSQTYLHVVLPQATRQILPALAGQFASLIKDSSLLSIIGLNEFTHSAQQVFSATYIGLGSFLPLGIGYLVLTIPIFLLSKRLEKKLAFES